MAWSMIGRQENTGSTSDLVDLSNRKQVRLLLNEMPNNEPISNWSYSISTPNDDYRTWSAPEGDKDFFAVNRRIFRVRPTHAALVYDYAENAIKILESGNQVWEQIKTLHEAGKDLNGRDIVITKTGTGRSTEYKVVDADPAPLNVDITNYPRPDITSRYVAPSYEAVIQDLKLMGFKNPAEIFETKPVSLEEAKNMKMAFGKYKDKTLGEVFQLESEYMLFLSTRIDREDIKQCARVISNNLLGTDFEVEGIAPSMEEVAYETPAAGGNAAPAPAAPQTPPAAPAPTNIQTHTDDLGNYYELHSNEWVLVRPAPPTPVTPPPAPMPAAPVPPAPMPAPPVPPAPMPVAPAPASGNRAAMIDEINATFENNQEYKDFQRIIQVMKEATQPNEKTVINDFTDDEVTKLHQLVVK